jgi:hypothetical protein
VSEENRDQGQVTKDDKSFWKPLLFTLAAFVLGDRLGRWASGPFAAGIIVFLLILFLD